MVGPLPEFSHVATLGNDDAQDIAARRYDIPAGPLGDALAQFAYRTMMITVPTIIAVSISVVSVSPLATALNRKNAANGATQRSLSSEMRSMTER